MAFEKKIFVGGGLDTDSEDRLLAPNDYRYALNIRSGSAEDADVGAITNLKGNTLISFDLPAGTNKCIGTKEDPKNNRVIYFVYNSGGGIEYETVTIGGIPTTIPKIVGAHQVLEYDYAKNTISLIKKHSAFNFQSDQRIWHINIIDDKLLRWVDNFNEPGKLNIERAKNVIEVIDGAQNLLPSSHPLKAFVTMVTFPNDPIFSVGEKVIFGGFSISSYNVKATILEIKNTGGQKYYVVDIVYIDDDDGSGRTARLLDNDGYPAPFKKQYVDAISYPPLCPPTAKYEDDTTVKINNLRGSLFQFKTQYVYIDAEKSAWSPISKLPLPTGGDNGEEKFANAQHIPETANNRIDVTYSTGDASVEKINIAARLGNTGDFFLIDTIEKDKLGITSNSFATYKFYNNKIYSSIEKKESDKLFDRVPRKAATQEFIDGNRLAYGNVLEDYDPVDIDVTVTPVYNDEFKPTDAPQPQITTSEEGTKNIPTLNPAVTLQVPAFNKKVISFSAQVQQGIKYTLSLSYSGEVDYQGTASPNTLPVEDVIGSDVDNALNEHGVNIADAVQFVKSNINFDYTAKQDDTANDVANFFATQMVNPFFIHLYYDSIRHYHPGDAHHPHVTPVALPAIITSVSGSDLILKSPKFTQWYRQNNISGDATKLFFFHIVPTINISATKVFGTTPIQRAFKRGATHELGIAYMDFANRSGHVNISKDTSVYVKFFAETPEKGHADMDIEISHKPPIWASHYQVVYSKNQTIEAFRHGVIDAVRTETISGSTVQILSLKKSITTYTEDNPNSILSFVPKVGDRLRVIKEASGNFATGLADIEILAFDTGTAEVTIPDTSTTPVGVFGSPNELVEIYSPKKGIDKKFYYEIGECYEIGDAGKDTRYHKSNFQWQTGSQPAIIQLRNEGDIYYKQRYMRKSDDSITSHMIEEFNFSDFYLSAHVNIGRVNIHDLNIKEIRRPTTVYHSEIYIPDSQINGLSNIFGTSFKEYDQSKGSIQKLYAEEKRLICFQELKVGAILVNEAIVFDQSGQSQIHKSQEILSDIVYYAGEFGIGTHPGSFAVYGLRKYFADINRGAVLRLSQDGITPISEYKMHNHFTDTFEEVRQAGGLVLAVYDIKFKEYILYYEGKATGGEIIGTAGGYTEGIFTVLTIFTTDTSTFTENQAVEVCYFNRLTQKNDCINSLLGSITSSSVRVFLRKDVVNEGDKITIKSLVFKREAIAFNEAENRWKTFYPFFTEMMSGAGINIVTFSSGKLYKHNDNVIANNFYGIQYTSKLDFIANEAPDTKKFYLGIEEEASNIWTVPKASENGQLTSLIKEDFEDDEGVFRAAFWKDKNSNGGLLEGEDMRGHSLKVSLENDSTKFQKLFMVGVRSEPSMRTGT